MPDDSVYCPTCQHMVASRDLSTKILEVSCCRTCGAVLQRSEQEEYTDKDSAEADDVAAIDIWVDDVAQTSNCSVTKTKPQAGRSEYTWLIVGCDTISHPSPGQTGWMARFLRRLSRLWGLDSWRSSSRTTDFSGVAKLIIIYNPQCHDVVKVCATYLLPPETCPTNTPKMRRAFARHGVQGYSVRTREAGRDDLAAMERAVNAEDELLAIPPPMPPVTQTEWGAHALVSTSQLSVELYQAVARRLEAAIREVANRVGVSLP
ncbi:MAG TPA: hypothetical protein VKA46_33870 [Gemmataceae bacterium]|nr:hypothetical protein [Gemmataceae bacterium]